jgi:hypothetical protein
VGERKSVWVRKCGCDRESERRSERERRQGERRWGERERRQGERQSERR